MQDRNRITFALKAIALDIPFMKLTLVTKVFTIGRKSMSIYNKMIMEDFM